MSFKTWLEAIIDGRKGDVLTLYALNILMDLHTYVHLHEGGYWTTLKKVTEMHEEILKCCDIHLLYLDHGLFVELTELDVLLEVIENPDPHVQSMIIGELTIEEQSACDEVLH